MMRARVSSGLLGIAAMLGATTGPVVAQTPTAAGDARWLPWIGCWEGATEVGATESERLLVCFRPLPATGGVEIVSYSEAELVGSEELRPDGVAVPVEEGGCSGDQTAGWSRDGSRVYLSSELRCGDTLARTTRGVLTFLPSGRGWIEIQAARAGEASPALGIRSFVLASRAALSELGIPDPSAGLELAVTTARSGAGAPLTPDAVVETVERAGPEVTSALIVERGEGFQLDASLLRSLAGRGVPGDVLDMMVAVTYPDRFQIAGSAEDAVAQMRLPPAPVRPTERAVAPWPDRGRAFLGYSPWRFGSFDPFWSDPYFYFSASRFGYGTGPYGYRPFGSPYYQVPRVIVLPPPTVEDRGATLDRNRGLVSNRGGSSGTGGAPSSATPSSRSGRQGAARAPSGSDARSAPRDSDSGGGSSSPEVRRAVPRSGDGGDR